jgi:hypothetical protein
MGSSWCGDTSNVCVIRKYGNADFFAYAEAAFVAQLDAYAREAVVQILLNLDQNGEWLVLQPADVDVPKLRTAPENKPRPALGLKGCPEGSIHRRLSAEQPYQAPLKHVTVQRYGSRSEL